MSQLSFKNPLSPSKTNGSPSLFGNVTVGTHFSALGVGGYQEVYNISDLIYTIPSNTYGIIEYSGNTIPISFSKGSGSTFSKDFIILNSDLISSGRRRLGMLVYVYETNQIYQYVINNYDNLWSAATASTGTVITNNFGTIVRANSSENQSFINAWTANTIEDVSGETSSTAVWKKLTTGGGTSGAYLPLSGGTLTGGLVANSGVTANTISATTYYNLPTDVFVTGGTYTSGEIIFTNNTGGTFNVSGFAVGGGGGQIFYLNLSQSQGSNRLLSTTGSTASEQSTGVTINNGVTGTIASFQSQPLNTTLLPGGIWSFYLHSYKQNNNASFNMFVEVYKRTSGGTQTLLFTTDPAPVTTNSPNPSMQLSDGYFSGTPLSVSDSIVAVVRATNTGNQSHIITLVSEGSQHYSYVVSTIPTQQGLTCDTLSVCSIIQTIQTDVSNKLDKSGGTITGNLIINSGLTATTISATTYQNLPGSSSSNCVTTFYATNISGCSPVNMLTEVNMLSGLTVTGNGYFTGVITATTISATTYQNFPTNFTSGLTASTISATTYQNLPTDIRTTGGTYSNNTFTFTNNTGGTYSVLFNTVTGLTVNGNLTVTGTTSSPTFTGNSITLSNSASTISLNNTTQQQIRFFSGGTGAPTYNTYSAGAKIILSDNIDSVSSGYAIGVDAGSLWYGADLAGNGHDWYVGTRKLMSLTSSSGLELVGLGGPGTSAAMTISGTSALGSRGGTGYTDFLQVINNWSGATNPNKWFRVNSIGGFEILNSEYSAQIFALTNNGILSVGGGNLATTSSSDGVTNYLMLGYNNTQIYDDGNTHIHSRAANQSMWINTNGGQLNLLAQSPLSGGSIGSGIAIATSTLNGYVTINTGRTVTTAASYGYLINSPSPTGQYNAGSQSLVISLYANNRIWGQEIDAFSDERMKNIEGEISLEEGIKLVNNLKPIKYTWKEGDDKGIKAGYSAQQVIKSGFNHLIGLIPTEGLEETVDEDGFLSPKDTQFAMNYDQVTPYHGVVIKHLLEEIENLKQEIKELKNKIK